MTLGMAMLGCAADVRGCDAQAIDADPALPSQRVPIDRPLWTGVRCIDTLLTIGRGARVGIFGEPGCGKSTLLETIVRGTHADAVVVGLVGERGREAQSWLERIDARTSIVCATGDRPAEERIAAASLAMSQACALATRGLHVLLVLDSLARVAYALREEGVARGESVGRAGYPPSVFAHLARLVERAGAFHSGSVTMLATVLSDGDDRDPVSEAARSLLDGHLQLSGALAQAGRFPAIDVLASTSRTMHAVVTPEHRAAASRVRAALAALASSADARSLGLEPADERTQAAVAAESQIERLLRQGPVQISPPAALEALAQTADMCGVDHGF